MALTVPVAHLQCVPYLKTQANDDRVVNLMPLWDGKKWQMWVPGPDGLFNVKPIDAGKVDYVARERASNSDMRIFFVESMWQRASYPEIRSKIRAICEDFHNLGASIAKLRFIFDSRHELPHGLSSIFANTEIEYLLMLSRSVFDLLQEMIADMWKSRVRLNDPEAEKRRCGRALPETFSKLVLHEKKTPRSSHEIQQDFGLPIRMADEYAKHTTFFSTLRDTRDAIAHDGKSLGHIYETEKGFCVGRNDPPFGSFDGWREEHQFNENVVSVLPWIANIVRQTIGACDGIVTALGQTVRFPDEIAPGYQVFVRGPCTLALSEILSESASPWWGTKDNDVLPISSPQYPISTPPA
jgi:hypothetical protein